MSKISEKLMKENESVKAISMEDLEVLTTEKLSTDGRLDLFLIKFQLSQSGQIKESQNR